MRKLILFLVFSLIVFSQGIYAQKEGIVHPRFRALSNSGERIEGKNGYFTSTTFNGILNNGQEISVSKSEIKALDVSSGSKTMQYAAIGAGIGLLVSLSLWAAPAGLEETGETWAGEDLNMAIIAPVAIVTGTLVGAIIGRNQTKWTRVPIRTTLNFDPKEKGAIFMVSIPFN